MTPEAGDEPTRQPEADGGQPSPSTGTAEETGADTPGGSGADVTGETATLTKHKPPEQEAFDWRGWLLVGVIVVSFLVVPAIVLYLPELHGTLSWAGLSLRQAYLVFPMIPALLLGALAVWAAVRSRTAG